MGWGIRHGWSGACNLVFFASLGGMMISLHPKKGEQDIAFLGSIIEVYL